MAYQEATYNGDDEYSIDCTGDVCAGDEVRFERAVFTGSFRSSKFAGFETITGKVMKESYGADCYQHTFTIECEDGSKLRIKGRNLYKNGTFRKPWQDESEREKVLNEKHKRGGYARQQKADKMYHGFL